MSYTNANPAAARAGRRLVYYIMIDGKSQDSLTFSFYTSPPDIWLRIQKKISYFAVMYRGVIFSVYDSEPFTDKSMVYGALDMVLAMEGLDYFE